jgi:hypothetical protein
MANIYGEDHPDGRVKTEPDTCAKSGRRINRDTSIRWHLPNSPYFVRVHHAVAHAITEDDKAAWIAGAPAPSQSPASTAGKSAKPEMEGKP